MSYTQTRELLRFSTAGSVDDGKSTLIGRLLYDSKSVFADQQEAIEAATKRRGGEGIDLALLTDGLRAEREQGITIDVAYRYFATPKRSFLVADTPGHVQYTRNMVTGASTAQVALILVDATRGVGEQTRRHLAIAALLAVPEVIVCVNKMDAVGWSRTVFDTWRAEIQQLAATLGLAPRFLPLSALTGDNVVTRSVNLPWFDGPALLELLETVEVAESGEASEVRLPVQLVLPPTESGGGRRYLGRIESGILRVGQKVRTLPGGYESHIAGIEAVGSPIDEAGPLAAVAIRLADELDLSRGALIATGKRIPEPVQTLDADACWLSEKPLALGGRYLIRHTTREVRAQVSGVVHKTNLTDLEPVPLQGGTIGPNDLARLSLRLAEPLFVEPYRQSRALGSLLLLDEASGVPVAALMV
jgi:sulfate adenylyltransferase large subunit